MGSIGPPPTPAERKRRASSFHCLFRQVFEPFFGLTVSIEVLSTLWVEGGVYPPHTPLCP